MFPKSISKSRNHKDFKQHTIVVCYHCKLLSEKLHLNDHKIQDLKWVSIDLINEYDFLPTTKCFIDIIEKN